MFPVQKPRNAQITAITIAGSIFATFSFFSHNRLIPTQKISIEPVRERLESAPSVMTGWIALARSVITPWKYPDSGG